jgi:hypothetical protein
MVTKEALINGCGRREGRVRKEPTTAQEWRRGGADVKPTFGGNDETFLMKVETPIYYCRVMAEV